MSPLRLRKWIMEVLVSLLTQMIYRALALRMGGTLPLVKKLPIMTRSCPLPLPLVEKALGVMVRRYLGMKRRIKMMMRRTLRQKMKKRRSRRITRKTRVGRNIRGWVWRMRGYNRN